MVLGAQYPVEAVPEYREALPPPSSARVAVNSFFDLDILQEYWPVLWDGLKLTIALAVVTFLFSLIPALVIAVARSYGPNWLGGVFLAVVSVVRAVPSVVAVVVIYFALPFVGVTFQKFTSIVIALTLVQIVYFSEVFRGGLAAVDAGQFDAAHALGMRTYAVLRHVVVPQSLVVAAPTFVSSCIQLFQNTTIAAVLTLPDLLTAALNVQTVTGNPTAVFVAALIYIAILLPAVWIVRYAEGLASRAR